MVPPRNAWEVILRPKTFSSGTDYRMTVPASPSGLTKTSLRVSHLRLWWTWDHGKPDLYTLDVRLLRLGRAIGGVPLPSEFVKLRKSAGISI